MVFQMPKSFRELLKETKGGIAEVSPDEVKARLDAKEKVAILDVREKDEFSQGHLPGTIFIPRGFLEQRIEEKIPDRAQPIVVYCAGGTRSAFAAKTLREMGYDAVASMAGGFGGWKDKGFPWVVPQVLDAALRKRYDRHLRIPEVGEEGQLKLVNAKVLLIGAGGLGSPTALYLAAAGVGTIGIVDSDVVDESNLQRQILHTTDRVGMPKVDSAEKAIRDLNPSVKVVKFHERLTSENVLRIFGGFGGGSAPQGESAGSRNGDPGRTDFDIVVDGSDNFATRYLVNDACVLKKIPNVHGSIFRFEGQVTVFAPVLGGPCYRCLYPEPPPPDLAPNCDEAGVLGVLPGIVGLLEATETIKLILGKGKTLVGRMLALDALETSFREFKLRRDPECPMCGENAEFKGFIDYEQFCAVAR